MREARRIFTSGLRMGIPATILFIVWVLIGTISPLLFLGIALVIIFICFVFICGLLLDTLKD